VDAKYIGIVFRASPKGDYDKSLQVITPEGKKTITAKSVKKSGAKLAFAAAPFAFCEFSASQKGSTYVLTGASQIEDFSSLSSDYEKLSAASLILECAATRGIMMEEKLFIFLLKCLKNVLFCGQPMLAAIKFIQYIIHNSGYSYEYKKEKAGQKTPLGLLTRLFFEDEITAKTQEQDISLVKKTLIAIIKNFESKFETEIKSKSAFL
jgi:DNA repair protein RecO